MGRLLLQKIGTTFVTLFGVASLVFIIFSVLPGDPAQMMLDQNEGSAQLEALKKKYGFDLPLPTQYVYFLNDFTTSGPIVRFGTKCPSITSMCIYSQLLESSAFISSLRIEKSADKIEGAILVFPCIIFHFQNYSFLG